MAVALILLWSPSARCCFTSTARGGGRRSPPTGATLTTPSASPSGSPARFLRGHRVHGLLRLPLPSQGRKTGGLQSRKQEARMVAHHRDRGRRWSHVGARPGGLAPVRHGSGRRHRDRSHGPAMATGASAFRARTAGWAQPMFATSARQPMGLNPDDKHGQDDVVIASDDLHLPVGKPVKVLLRSLDVLHDFYVPEFRAKMDMVPGMVTYFWMTPIRTGTFDVLCAELCGCARADARQGFRRRRERLSGLAGEAEDVCGIVRPKRRQEGHVQIRRQ